MSHLPPPGGGLVAEVKVAHAVAEIHGGVIKGVPRRLCQKVQGAGDLLDQHEA